MAMATPISTNIGTVVQVIGPVVDVEFEAGRLPAIYNAVRIVDRRRPTAPSTIDVVAEVEQHLGENRVRSRRDAADRRHGARHEGDRHRRADHGAGRPGDARPRAERARRAGRRPDRPGERRRSAGRSTARRPSLEEQSTELEMFETGIKVIDLLEPYLQGGKIGLFGGAGVGKTVIIRS